MKTLHATKFCAALLATAFAGTASAATLVVDADGGGDHTTISAAVAAATAGDTIQVNAASTVYNEQVLVDKSLTIIGMDDVDGRATVTFIGAGGTSYATLRSGSQKPVIAIGADDVTIDNLVIRATQDAVDTTRRSGIVAQDNRTGAFNNLLIQNCEFAMDAVGRSTWEHIGVYLTSTTAPIESVRLINNDFVAGAAVPAIDIDADFASYFDLKGLFSKSMRFYGVKVNVIGNDSMGWFRDIHMEQLEETFVQNNIFRNSVESTSARSGQVRVVGNRFTGEFYYKDTNDVMFYDPDYASAFASPYAGPIDQYVAGYQDELLFLKSNESASLPYIIDNNVFVTRRFGINLGRSTNVTIRRNLFITDPSTDAALPPDDFWGAGISVVYPQKRHINIDSAWFSTCCGSSDVPGGFAVDIVGNDFEGTGAVAVNVTDEQPATNDAISAAGNDFPAGLFNVAGNDFDPDVVAFQNDYAAEVQPFELDNNFFGQPGGPLPGQTANNVGAGGEVTTASNSPVTQVNDSDGDGLLDGEETGLYNTLPNNKDSDGDGYSDGLEVLLGYPSYTNYDPNNPGLPVSAPVDTDGDGIPDAFDINPGVADVDSNGDGVLDYYAFLLTGSPISQVSLGDVNRDGVRTNSDAIQILEVFLGLRVLTGTSSDYDVNRDGLVDNVDAIILFQASLNNIPVIPFPFP